MEVSAVSRSQTSPVVQAFFDPATNTVSYVVKDPGGRACAIIDPVLDYDPKSGRTTTRCAGQIAEYVTEHELNVEWLLETHAHADHLSAAPYLKDKLGGHPVPLRSKGSGIA
ncbi:MAG: MBL fold metallo-hydrolase [Alphaproteobacteria bacterium]|nr:MBL fold metallo-hydrolase [Alphaproteobacteria bacterium]